MFLALLLQSFKTKKLSFAEHYVWGEMQFCLDKIISRGLEGSKIS